MSASILRRVWAQNAASPVRCSNQYAIAVVVPELSYNQTYELQWRLAYWVSLYSVDSQLLNCVFDNSRIVIFTIQELWKSQCNNTDINNTDYSDTDSFLSFPSMEVWHFLKCDFDIPRSVVLTPLEVWKWHGNNTDNNYTDYSNAYPFLSVLESLDMKGMKLLQ